MNVEVSLGTDGEIAVSVRDIHPIEADSARQLARDLTLDLARALARSESE